MKKTLLLILFAFLSLSCYSINKNDLLTNITNQITIVKSEIKNLDVKIKIDKTNSELLSERESFKSKLSTLESEKKIVEKSIKKDNEMADALKKYEKLKNESDELNKQVEAISKAF